MALLLDAELRGTLPPLLPFWGHRPDGRRPIGPWVLSQWWPVDFTVDGVGYRHAEGFMMAGKARLFGDDGILGKILDAEQPAVAKKLGREVAGFDQARWVAARYDLVVAGNVAKFTQHEDLAAYLRSTAPRVLIEASPRDRIWGIGLGAGNDAVRQPSLWRGDNLLGFALMEVRDRISANT